MFRFRHFSIRLLALLLGLLFATLATTYVLVSRASQSNARAHAEANLEVAARIYDDAIAQQIAFLVSNAGVMTDDATIRQALQADHPDAPTLGSALQSYTQRVHADVIALFGTDGQLIANNSTGMPDENAGPFRYLIGEATQHVMPEASGLSYLNGRLHALVVVPLYAPYPRITHWFGLSFALDSPFAQRIKATTGIETSFISTASPAASISTLPPADLALVARHVADRGRLADRVQIISLTSDRYVSLFRPQILLGEDPITVVLQRPLSAELAASRDLENTLLLISLAALAAATLVALWLARGVSQPVRQLAAHTRLIAAGDYATRLDLTRADELGQLAGAMNQMSAGLAERDQVRDLLDKNVSPEVAAQLLRDGATLGGEEREVTILFADLRGFTTLSEKLTPQDLLHLLNRYLDRMSAAIEAHGGIIDKYIGDAIMALFGAPVAQADAADRALAAARAMERTLADLNRELAAEGRPPLALGLGINTARVVAGNIGSLRRLNYSVIGDGVNVAARLQSLTRNPEYHTNAIISAATLAALRTPTTPAPRPLCTVAVKGRNEPVEIFAI